MTAGAKRNAVVSSATVARQGVEQTERSRHAEDDLVHGRSLQFSDSISGADQSTDSTGDTQNYSSLAFIITLTENKINK